MNLPSPQPANGKSKELLGSWKEIATFLNRGVRTVQRWEREEHLPVRRHDHNKRATVFAVASEVEEWMKNRSGSDRLNTPSEHASLYADVDPKKLEARCIAARARAQNARDHVRQVYEYYQGEISRVLARLKQGGSAIGAD